MENISEAHKYVSMRKKKNARRFVRTAQDYVHRSIRLRVLRKPRSSTDAAHCSTVIQKQAFINAVAKARRRKTNCKKQIKQREQKIAEDSSSSRIRIRPSGHIACLLTDAATTTRDVSVDAYLMCSVHTVHSSCKNRVKFPILQPQK
jgi:hypothetical protein